MEEVTERPSWEEIISTGIIIREKKDNTQWKLGDLALLVTVAYGKDSLGKFSTEVGLARSTMYQYRKVAETFTPETRIPRLSHRHHAKATSTERPQEWLEKADANNWSSERLAVEISKEKGQEITKNFKYLLCETCFKPIPREDIEFCDCK